MNKETSIAVVGMAGRFPGSDTLDAFWTALDEGRDAVRDYAELELRRTGVDPALLADPGYVRRGAHLRDIDRFDASFFGYTGREAELMDPQQRIFLELCHEALERAGHGPGTFDGVVGVCAGTRRSGYGDLLNRPEYDNVTDEFIASGNEPDALATKIAYKLGCTGPAFTVQTYCSSSLVAVHLACRQLLYGECDMALAGGVALRIPQHTGYLWRPGGTRSRHGRCRPFDAAADGLIFGDGAGVVVLRPLEDAEADGDPVLAVIRGSAVTNDGARRAGYAAPGVAGQVRALREALEAADVDPAEVSYVETHGAGTPLGDGIEIKALSQVFGGRRRGHCAIGSVKANVGHLDAAAGITGLIKTVLALRHRRIPGTLNFELPNPEIDLIDSPFYIAAESADWESPSGPRIAGVSSLGIGGTNAHVVLQEAPEVPDEPSVAVRHLFVLSAKSGEALDAATVELRRHLEEHPELNPADVAHTLQCGRQAHRHRRALIAGDCAEAARGLRNGTYRDGDAMTGGEPRLSGDPLEDLAARWLHGDAVDFGELYPGERRRRVPLPTQPMLRKRHWPDPVDPEFPPAGPSAGTSPAEVPTAQSAEVPSTEARTIEVPSTVGVPSTEEAKSEAPYVDPILPELIAIVAERFKVAPEDLDPDVPFLELGGDSMLLLSVLPVLEDRYGCRLSLRQFFSEFQTLTELAGYLRGNAPAERLAPPGTASPATTAPAPADGAVHPAIPASAPPDGVATPPAEPVAAPGAPVVPASAGAPVAQNPAALSQLERLVTQQLSVMQRQLELMAGQGATVTGPAPAAPGNNTAVGSTAAVPAPAAGVDPLPTGPASAQQLAPAPGQASAPTVDKPRVPLAPGKRATATAPAESARRARYLQTLVKRYNDRTRRSKEFAQRFRPMVSDSRSTIGFRLSTKELLYPLVAERGRGSRLWDVDGNEYVDLTLGFGVHLLGHNPPVVMDALRERMADGFSLGPRTALVEDVAASILELTGMERVAFVNTGSEAVITALRLARAATGRDKIVLFSTGYHGHSDGVLAAPRYDNGRLRSQPISAGISPSAVENVYVLEFGSPQALDFIHQHASELAAVVTEPVTTRHPGEQDPGFLHRLREITLHHGIKLMFDEMVTGFRCHPAGVQGLLGIEADLVTYGKVIGGGMPLGVIAGRGGVMDAIDGGVWNFGNDSYPSVESTFFGGTFNQHPLSMVASKAVLDHLRAEGPALQERLNDRTARFVDQLNQDLRELQAPIEIRRFSSLFRFEHDVNADLFYYNLIDRGVFMWEWRNCFLSTAHEDADLLRVREAVKDSVRELQDNGVLGTAHSVASGRGAAPATAGAPATEPEPVTTGAPASGAASAPAAVPGAPRAALAQKQLWALAQTGEAGSLAYNLSTALWLEGPLDSAALRTAVAGLAARHESLRTTFSPDGERLVVHEAGRTAPDGMIDERFCTGEEDLAELLAREADRPFDLERGPVFRVVVVRTDAERHLLLLVVHHAVADGWSTVTIVRDLFALYGAAATGGTAELPPAVPFRAFLDWQEEFRAGAQAARQRDYWHQLLAGAPEPALPTTAAGTPPHRASRRSVSVGPELAERLRSAASAAGVTVFAHLVAAWAATLHRLTGQQDLVLPVAAARRPPRFDEVVGYCTNVLPLRLRTPGDTTVAELLGQVQGALLDALEHQNHPFAELVCELGSTGGELRSGLLSTSIAFDRELAPPPLHGLRVTQAEALPIRYTAYAVAVNVLETADGYRFDFDIAEELFAAELAERLPHYCLALLRAMMDDGGRRLDELDHLTDNDRAQLLSYGTGPRGAEPSDGPVHTLLAAQALKNPDGIALQCGDRLVPHAALDSATNRMARALRRRYDVGAGAVFGIAVADPIERSEAVLAVWKSGAAFVALPPGAPGGVPATGPLTAVLGTGEGPDGSGVPWLSVTGLRADAEREESEALEPVALTAPAQAVPAGDDGSVAWVSDHRAVLNAATAEAELLSLDQDTVLYRAVTDAQSSAWSVVLPLLGGGRLRLPEDADPLTSPAWDGGGADVTVLETDVRTLTRLVELADGGSAPALPALRHVLVRGLVDAALAARWSGHYPGAVLHGSFQTERTAGPAFHQRPAAERDPAAPGIVVGAVPHARVSVRDDASRPCPPGVPGELCVEGAAAARELRWDADRGWSARDGEDAPVGTGLCARWLDQDVLELLPERVGAEERDVTAGRRGEVARVVLTHVRELLGIEEVSLDDDFFELGGNSVSAVQLAQRFRKEVDVERPVRMVFENRPLRALVETLTVRSSG
ncbi:aminotransferase class III-fold pyridoxal phosphate-dependent enzyme [Streptomyces sp. NBC_00076]|uniref:aminotransferase class III-fold pyridoxal phosphate-dependent enzyme n=1 Tax=Streptomyces sp. NBC_00076 TaxID=2975642 RepID=UPI00324C8664